MFLSITINPASASMRPQRSLITKLRKNMIKFRPYGTSVRLPVMGKVKVTLKARAGAKINTTVYVVKDQEESLLGKKDGRRLGIITIDPEGLEEAIRKVELEEKVKNISTVTKQKVKEEGKISSNQTQKEIDEDMKKIIGSNHKPTLGYKNHYFESKNARDLASLANIY